jgi:type IV fimbrial biogenesis protein FimT
MKNTLFTESLSVQRWWECSVDLSFHSCQSRTDAEAGFTLMELLVVIVIVGIMASLAAPSFSSFIANSRISSATNDLIADLIQARSTASTNGHHVVICPSTNGTSCSTTVSDWAIGRIVFIDNNANGTYDTSDTLLKHATGLPSNLTVTMTNFPNTYIAYNSYGGMFPLGAGQFTLCVKGASQDRQISIDYSGHPLASRVPQSC